MPLDVNYTNQDNVLSDSTGSYEWTSAARPIVERSVCCQYRVIDGVGVGNRAWTELERGFNTDADREKLKRFTREAIQWIVSEGMIRPPTGESEVVIEVDDAVGVSGLANTAAVRIQFFDVPAGHDDEVSVTAPPWGV